MDSPFPLKHGNIKITAIADPAVATGFTYTPSPRLIEQLYSIFYILTRDANAASVRVSFDIDDTTRVITRLTTAQSNIVSTTNRVSWLINGPDLNNSGVAGAENFLAFIPPDLILPIGATITQILGNVQVGDQVSAIVVLTKIWSRT